jgi:transposase
MTLRVREVLADEGTELRRLVESRTAEVREVERARIIWLAWQGWSVPAIARELRLCEPTVRTWLKRFNASGLAGLQDRRRGGRPSRYGPEQIGRVVALALADPDALDLPFGCWTLDRLAEYLHEVEGIPIQRSRIAEVLRAEGLRWRTQESWFGERVDPAFAEKRGPSSPSTPRRLRAQQSSASTNSGRSRPRASWAAGSSSPPRRTSTR